MRFCFVSAGYGSMKTLSGQVSELGGAEAQIAHLAAGLARVGHQVELIYGNGRPGGCSKVGGVRCVEAFPAWKKPASLLRFWQLLEHSKPDVIYTRLPHDFLCVIGLFTKLHPTSRAVYAVANDAHCNPWRTYNYRSWFHNSLYMLGLQVVDIVVLQHERQRELIRPYTRAMLYQVPNLISSFADEPRRFEQADIDAIWVAQIRPQKQLDVFLDVVESLPHIRFAVVGGFAADMDGKTQAALQSRMRGLSNLRYFGLQHHDNVRALLAQSKILVTTSAYEGFPNTMLEAWSVGVPVVSLTVDPSNVMQREAMGVVSGSVPQMIHDIAMLVRDQMLNDDLGGRGLEYVRKNHTLRAVCAAFEQFLPGMAAQGSVLEQRTA